MSTRAKRLYLVCLSNGEVQPHFFVGAHCWDPQLTVRQTTTVLESGVAFNVSIVSYVLYVLCTHLRKYLLFSVFFTTLEAKVSLRASRCICYWKYLVLY